MCLCVEARSKDGQCAAHNATFCMARDNKRWMWVRVTSLAASIPACMRDAPLHAVPGAVIGPSGPCTTTPSRCLPHGPPYCLPAAAPEASCCRPGNPPPPGNPYPACPHITKLDVVCSHAFPPQPTHPIPHSLSSELRLLSPLPPTV